MNCDPASYLLVMSTCPDDATARRIAAALVEGRHAACVNVVTGVTSVYRWQGRIHEDAECLLLIKTRRDDLDTLQREILALHPYELPELVAVPFAAGLPGYLKWIDDSMRPAE